MLQQKQQKNRQLNVSAFSLQLIADMGIIDLKLSPIGEKQVNVYIKAENFGPIEKAEVDLRPLTVFVGESNTGKTYLAALIYALHQNFGMFSQLPFTYFTHILFLNRLLHHYSGRRQPELEEETEEEIEEVLEKLNTPGWPFKFSDLPQWMRAEFLYKLTDPEYFANELKRCFDLESVSKLIRFTGSKDNEMKLSLQVCEGDQTYWNFRARDAGSGFTVGGHINSDIVLLNLKDKIPNFFHLFEHLYIHGCVTRDSYYLPAARSGILQSREVITSSLIKRATRIGLDIETSKFSGVIADFLEHIVLYEERNTSLETIEGIAKKLEDELLGGEIGVNRPIPGVYPQFLYRPEQAEEGLRMSHASAMISELAPLVLFPTTCC